MTRCPVFVAAVVGGLLVLATPLAGVAQADPCWDGSAPGVDGRCPPTVSDIDYVPGVSDGDRVEPAGGGGRRSLGVAVPEVWDGGTWLRLEWHAGALSGLGDPFRFDPADAGARPFAGSLAVVCRYTASVGFLSPYMNHATVAGGGYGLSFMPATIDAAAWSPATLAPVSQRWAVVWRTFLLSVRDTFDGCLGTDDATVAVADLDLRGFRLRAQLDAWTAIRAALDVAPDAAPPVGVVRVSVCGARAVDGRAFRYRTGPGVGPPVPAVLRGTAFGDHLGECLPLDRRHRGGWRTLIRWDAGSVATAALPATPEYSFDVHFGPELRCPSGCDWLAVDPASYPASRAGLDPWHGWWAPVTLGAGASRPDRARFRHPLQALPNVGFLSCYLRFSGPAVGAVPSERFAFGDFRTADHRVRATAPFTLPLLDTATGAARRGLQPPAGYAYRFHDSPRLAMHGVWPISRSLVAGVSHPAWPAIGRRYWRRSFHVVLPPFTASPLADRVVPTLPPLAFARLSHGVVAGLRGVGSSPEPAGQLAAPLLLTLVPVALAYDLPRQPPSRPATYTLDTPTAFVGVTSFPRLVPAVQYVVVRPTAAGVPDVYDCPRGGVPGEHVAMVDRHPSLLSAAAADVARAPLALPSGAHLRHAAGRASAASRVAGAGFPGGVPVPNLGSLDRGGHYAGFALAFGGYASDVPALHRLLALSVPSGTGLLWDAKNLPPAGYPAGAPPALPLAPPAPALDPYALIRGVPTLGTGLCPGPVAAGRFNSAWRDACTGVAPVRAGLGMFGALRLPDARTPSGFDATWLVHDFCRSAYVPLGWRGVRTRDAFATDRGRLAVVAPLRTSRDLVWVGFPARVTVRPDPVPALLGPAERGASADDAAARFYQHCVLSLHGSPSDRDVQRLLLADVADGVFGNHPGFNALRARHGVAATLDRAARRSAHLREVAYDIWASPRYVGVGADGAWDQATPAGRFGSLTTGVQARSPCSAAGPDPTSPSFSWREGTPFTNLFILGCGGVGARARADFDPRFAGAYRLGTSHYGRVDPRRLLAGYFIARLGVSPGRAIPRLPGVPLAGPTVPYACRSLPGFPGATLSPVWAFHGADPSGFDVPAADCFGAHRIPVLRVSAVDSAGMLVRARPRYHGYAGVRAYRSHGPAGPPFLGQVRGFGRDPATLGLPWYDIDPFLTLGGDGQRAAVLHGRFEASPEVAWAGVAGAVSVSPPFPAARHTGPAALAPLSAFGVRAFRLPWLPASLPSLDSGRRRVAGLHVHACPDRAPLAIHTVPDAPFGHFEGLLAWFVDEYVRLSEDAGGARVSDFSYSDFLAGVNADLATYVSDADWAVFVLEYARLADRREVPLSGLAAVTYLEYLCGTGSASAFVADGTNATTVPRFSLCHLRASSPDARAGATDPIVVVRGLAALGSGTARRARHCYAAHRPGFDPYEHVDSRTRRSYVRALDFRHEYPVLFSNLPALARTYRRDYPPAADADFVDPDCVAALDRIYPSSNPDCGLADDFTPDEWSTWARAARTERPFASYVPSSTLPWPGASPARAPAPGRLCEVVPRGLGSSLSSWYVSVLATRHRFLVYPGAPYTFSREPDRQVASATPWFAHAPVCRPSDPEPASFDVCLASGPGSPACAAATP